jgi:hypothetical protein
VEKSLPRRFFRDPRQRRWLEETSVVEQRGAMGLGAGVVFSNMGTSRVGVTIRQKLAPFDGVEVRVENVEVKILTSPNPELCHDPVIVHYFSDYSLSYFLTRNPAV